MVTHVILNTKRKDVCFYEFKNYDRRGFESERG